ncbi:MAG: serine acetyltransferase [Cyclobacteriaceae bacterium]|nr:serine acetyltransferase [Cyclobacteriaceae bacterium]MCH8517298.1 serine acetyltransferase [Cyclobacteriaceae bacterium]
MDEQFIRQLYQEHQKEACCPPPRWVISFFDRLLGLLFPQFAEKDFHSAEEIAAYGQMLKSDLVRILQHGKTPKGANYTSMATAFFDALPDIKSRLMRDVDAVFEGDPAAKSHTEVIRTYPGFYAIVAHRIANYFHEQEVELMPRIISEYAHGKTGIDIHPGAKIGDYFCIDHGTGVVIGETTIIGKRVKIYQGVTLGALSVKKEDARSQRHPILEDGVVVYAGATILGGTTVIGKDSVIGGNVWLTQSVPPQSKVYYKAKMSHSDGESDEIVFNH